MGFKRRFQKGHVLKKGKRGQQVWYGMWREDVPKADGGFTRHQRSARLGSVSEFPYQSNAEGELSKLMNQQPSLQMTFSELADRWTKAEVPTIKESTANFYLKVLKTHVIPAFGNREIASITREDVQNFLAAKANLYSRNTLRGMRASLGVVLSWAVNCKSNGSKWLEDNPCARVKLPRDEKCAGKKIKRAILDPEKTQALADKLEEPYATLVLFLSTTGLRVGEAVGIKWSDFNGNELRVSRRIYEGKQGDPKSEDSARNLPISETLMTRMRTLGEGEWVFRSRNGTTINPGNALRRYLHPAARELGFHLSGWHDFRHTVATESINSGAPIKRVSQLLGHSDIRTTMKYYQKVASEDFRGLLKDRAERLLSNVSKSAVVPQSAEYRSLN